MRSWLELLRISNLPTVWTNLMAGGFVSYSFWGELHLGSMILVLVSGTCLYLAGMVLNDVFDLEIDRSERPGRPIPSGRISRRAATMLGTILLLAGASLPWAISMATGTIALVLAGLVVLYERIHAATAWSVLVMAACRAGLYVMAGFAINASIPDSTGAGIVEGTRGTDGMGVVCFIAIPVFIHVACFSMIARFEVPEVRETCSDFEAASRSEMADSRLQRMRKWCGTGTLVLILPFISCCGLSGIAMTNENLGYASGVSSPGPLLMVVSSLVATIVVGSYLVVSTRGLLREPRKVGRFVLRSIAVMSIYDAMLCGVIATNATGWNDKAAIPATIACVACFLLVRWGHRRIPGT